MKWAQVSVVVPTFNQASFLPECLDSVLAQTHRPVRVVVVDDGSTDDTARVLEKFASTIEPIRTVNRGVSAARNLGLQFVDTEFVAFCDSDDVWRSDKLRLQLESLAGSSSQWCHCGIEVVDSKGASLGINVNGVEGWAFESILRMNRRGILGGGSGVLVRTQALRSIGGFNSSLSTSADWEVFARLALMSTVKFVPEPLVRYRMHSENMHRGVDRWKADKLAAIQALADMKVVPPRELRRARATLHMQVSGELAHRGDMTMAVQEGLVGLLQSPTRAAAALKGVYRLAGRRFGRSSISLAPMP